VRELLGLKAGDTLCYRLTDDGVLLDKATSGEGDDPFAAFSEWAGEADEKAYAKHLAAGRLRASILLMSSFRFPMPTGLPKSGGRRLSSRTTGVPCRASSGLQ
jgi:hypothetical protein